MKKKIILKSILLISCLACIIIGSYFLLKHFNLDNIDTLRNIVNQGIGGIAVFVILQILQVVFIPISTTIFTIPAIILFGPLKAFLISWVGVTLGSITMFLIAKIWGVKVLKWLVGEEKSVKYANLLGKGKYLLPVFLLIPIFPDDIICASAGLSNCNPLYFIIVVMITRCIDTACTCFIGTSLIQSVGGIIVLCVFIVAMLIVSILLTKHQEKVETWLIKIFSRKKND